MLQKEDHKNWIKQIFTYFIKGLVSPSGRCLKNKNWLVYVNSGSWCFQKVGACKEKEVGASCRLVPA